MVPGGGTIWLRGGDEPMNLAVPTTFTADQDDTGVVTGGTLITPELDFEFPVVEFNTTAFIHAAFTELNPGTATGSVDKDHRVTLDLRLAVDMHIDIGGSGGLVADCRAAPINLGLSGLYDPDTRRVTLVDTDFSIPAMPTAAPCGDLIGPRVNELLSGPGHSIQLIMEGNIDQPTIGSDLTTTSLEVAPAQTRAGDEVTMTAHVARVEEGPVDPMGLVEFRDGGAVIGTVALDASGDATFTTTELPEGTRQLSARYQGDPIHRFSESAVVEHKVARAPTVTVNMTSAIVVGGYVPTAHVIVTNPTDGADVANARLDFTLARTDGGFFDLVPAQLAVEHLVGETWEPITLTQGGSRVLRGTVGVAEGAPLLAGTEQTVLLRLAAPDLTGPPGALCLSFPIETACPGPLDLTVDLAEVEPDDGMVVSASLARAVHSFHLVEDLRRPTSLMFPLGRPVPHTLRPGYSVEIAVLIMGTVGNNPPTGTAEILLDGSPIEARSHTASFDEPPTSNVPLAGGGTLEADLLLPPDIEPGEHLISVRYSGDSTYQPSETSSRVTVLEAIGHPFVCRSSTLFTRHEMGASIRFDADVPAAAAAGDTVEVDVASATITMGRPGFANPLNSVLDDGTTTPVNAGPRPPGAPQLAGVSIGFTPDGTGSASGVTRAGGSTMFDAYPADESAVDQILTLEAPTAAVAVDGEPGDVVPVELDEVVLDMVEALGLPVPLRCVPVDEPLVVGEVEVAGTSVSVSSERVRTPDEVTIEARTFPAGAAGTVTFSSDRDGMLGTDAVSGGVASLTTDELSVGTHAITASFDATDPGVPDTVSFPVTVRVWPEFDCPAFAVGGNGAVVRLVYLELLGRCPDQAGFDYWKGRLDGGTSPVVFARTISATPEAVGRVVDDAYVTMLGRPADTAGRVFWVGRLQGHGRYDQLLADLGASPEFWAQSGSSNEGFVTRVYDRLLNRAPDQGGLEFWVGRLDAGTSPRALILSLANLDEPLGVLVVASYGEILDRAPNNAERATGIRHLRTTGDRSGLYAELIGRPEFSTRAQTFPNPEERPHG